MEVSDRLLFRYFYSGKRDGALWICSVKSGSVV